MVGVSLRRRATAAALALLCAGFLSTCDFLTADIFPSWLSYVEARYDLRSEVKVFSSILASTENFLVEYVQPFSGRGVVALFLPGTPNKRLVFLDSNTLRKLHHEDNSEFSPLLAAASIGQNMVCGKVSINTTDFVLSAGPTDGLDGSRQWLVRIGPDSDQYLIGFNSGMLEVNRHKYDYSFAYINTISGTDWVAPYPTDYWELLDSEMSSSGAGAMFLFRNTSDEEVGYLSVFSASADIEANPRDFLNAANQVTGPFRIDDGRAWITHDGPVAYHRGDKGPDRLVRYELGTGSALSSIPATELDSIPFDDNDELRVLSFDPSGRWWFAYDRRTGYLYKLRTWWK